MKQTASQASGFLLALLLLVLAAVGFFEFVKPAYANLMTLKGQVAADRALLASEQQLATKAQDVLTQYEAQSSSTQAVNLALPVGPDSADAIAQLYGVASASGLQVANVGIAVSAAPRNAVATTAYVANGTSTTAAAVIKPYGTLTFQLSATGSYEALKTFLQGLEQNVRVFDVTALSIRPVATLTTSGVTLLGSQDLYTYSITATAYYQPS
jgi:Tfp pilus assembly protein PilO